MITTAKRNSAKCLALLEALGCEPTPKAYAVAYAYIENPKGSVAGAVDGLLKDGMSPDVKTMEDLHGEHLAGEDGRLVAAATRELTDHLAQAMQIIGDATASTEGFGRSLTQAGEGLKSGTQASEVVVALLAKTRSMAEDQAGLSQRLKETQDQVETLREQCRTAADEARRDPMTGLRNRRSFEEEMARDIARAERTREPMSLIMVDIDRFKSINDQWGHQTGDRVIQGVAELMKGCVRTTDLPARIGGEEFAVILSNADLDAANVVAERIRSVVSRHRLIVASKNEQHFISVSVGVAQFRSGEMGLDLTARADAALYAAKNGGRNRVVTDVELDHENEADADVAALVP